MEGDRPVTLLDRVVASGGRHVENFAIAGAHAVRDLVIDARSVVADNDRRVVVDISPIEVFGQNSFLSFMDRKQLLK